jgi:GNAT superfamily N-acetyltransferase
MRVLEGALLDVDPRTVRSALGDGEAAGAAVAVDGGRVVGAVVWEGSRVVAIAVVPARRGAGLGRALVDRADAATTGTLTATFDGRVRQFYAALGFEVEATDSGGRYRGVRR